MDLSNMRGAEEPAKRVSPGEPVVITLQSPREKCWGILDEITPAGVFLRGIDLNDFDEWTHAVAHKELVRGLNDLFFPLWRVERISRDEPSGGEPSLTERLETRTGRHVRELLGFTTARGN